ncbi:TonB-dependent receptor [Labilibaculum euxinus]|uniref:Outer membrane beta-barrel protein n=1 Tax=Labilibaculum euxinus TaxID=2686357 RepID=A0A7M4D0Z1_9BACT|nr:TonB-dependent receptor [Labilibaculum euxinus]MUP36320.1 outer membrane beta-barrel protein [Labilibaculum euxinus]MVB05525.1 outer membrane beta-barrel protein [Labilibaculum euxinus]
MNQFFTIHFSVKLLITVFFISTCPIAVLAQIQLNSKVVSEDNKPLLGASVVVLNPADSTLLTGTITDEKGEFAFNNLKKRDFILHVSFVGYQTKMIASSVFKNNTKPIILSSSDNKLKEVTVAKARNVVKIEENKIIFNTQTLSETRAASNAFELLDYVPGLLVQNDQVSVVGSSRVTLVINNKITNMSMSQALNFLRSAPASDVKNIEYYFVAPKRFNVHGALINVELKHGIEKGKYSGNVSGNYLRGRKNSYNGNMNFSVSKGKFDLQGIVQHEKNENLNKQKISTFITSDSKSSLKQDMDMNYDKSKQLYSLNPRFNINENSYIDLQYSFIPDKNKVDTYSDVNLNTKLNTVNTVSKNTSLGNSDYQNIALNYKVSDANFGISLTNYQDPTDQSIYILNDLSDFDLDYTTHSTQDIMELNAFANNTSSITKGKSSLEYGISYKKIENKSTYKKQLAQSRFRLTEDRANAYLSLNYQFSPKLSSVFALELEYDKLNFTDKKKQEEFDVVNDYFVFPTLDMTYVASNNHIFKYNFTSFSDYPSFWDLTPNTWSLTPYASVQGNSSLKPQKNYNSQLVYIFKGKYILVFSADLSHDWITQVPFNSEDGYSINYQTINIDKNYTTSMALVVPFSIYKPINSKFTTSISRNQQTDNSHDNYSIDKTNVNFYFSLNNSITLNKTKQIFADLNAYYASGRPQGFYDLDDSFNVDASLRMSLFSNTSLLFSCKDIFNSKTPDAKTQFVGQKNDFKFDFDTRRISLGFIYNFGEKIKMRKETSDLKPSDRFQRN